VTQVISSPFTEDPGAHANKALSDMMDAELTASLDAMSSIDLNYEATMGLGSSTDIARPTTTTNAKDFSIENMDFGIPDVPGLRISAVAEPLFQFNIDSTSEKVEESKNEEVDLAASLANLDALTENFGL